MVPLRSDRHAAWAATLVATALSAFLGASPVGAARATIGLDEIRPGMKGYGLTVFSGTEPEKFDVEVLSIVPNFLLRQSIILVRVSHPVTDKAGIVGGMSGSPVYLDGRLAGAIAYGWTFAKEPLAGVTPIADMVTVLERKEREIAAGRARRALLPVSFGEEAARGETRYFSSFEGQPLAPGRTPISLAGFAGEARQIIADALAPFAADLVQGGGGGKTAKSAGFAPGSAIGVQLVRGDMSAVGIGTVTLVDGPDVLAFGHPLLNSGQSAFPVTTAEIHAVHYSVMRSSKIGSPLAEAGSLVQDRQAAISARTDRRAEMIPVGIALSDPRGGRRDSYSVEMISHRQLTPRLLQAALVNVIAHGASDIADVVAEVTGRIKISGRPEVSLTDAGTSRTGLWGLTHFFRPVLLVGDIIDNPFEEARVESLGFDVRLSYGRDVATIVGVSFAEERPSPGGIATLAVRLRRYDGPEETVRVEVPIPEAAMGQEIHVEAAGGDFATPVLPAPRSLDDVIENTRRYFPPKSLVVTLAIPGEGVTLRGRAIERLPASAMDAIMPLTGKDQVATERAAVRRVVPMPIIVLGAETIRVTVGSRRKR